MAFCGCESLKNITIPKSVKSISDNAFTGCDKLSNITILNKDCEIYDFIDEEEGYYGNAIPKATTINGYKGSTAETYAKKFGNKFVALSETTKLSAPTLKATVNANGTFTLSWNKITGAEKYEIYYKQADGSYKLLKTVTGTSYTTVVAAKGKAYTYKVRAVTSKNKNATSNYSNVVNAKRK